MAERRRGKKKREVDEIVDDDKSLKISFEVAKYLRSKLPPKRTTLLGHKVDYFIASKAIDCLLDSKWAKNDKGDEAMFTTRESVVCYMQRMLANQFFHRAKPIIVSKKDNRKKGEDPPESSAAEDTREKKRDKAKKEKKEKSDKLEKDGEKDKSKESKHSKGESDDKDEKDESKDTEKDNKDENDDKEPKEVKEKKEGKDGERKKEKKKVKLDMHLEQIFVDGNHPYVWIYDPIPVKTWFIGALFVIAAIAICLFPLWPKTVRNFVYYLSLAGAGFLLFVFSLVILRFVIFVIIWLLTFGKHNFWILPNLTEDVGVLESFWPLYQYEYKGSKKNEDKDDGSKEENENDDSKEKSKGKKEKKQKAEDDQTGDEGLIDVKSISRKGSKTTEDEDEDEEEEEEEERSDEVTEEDGEDAPLLESDDGSSNPVKSNNGDNDNGFEILDVHESS